MTIISETLHDRLAHRVAGILDSYPTTTRIKDMPALVEFATDTGFVIRVQQLPGAIVELSVLSGSQRAHLLLNSLLEFLGDGSKDHS